MSRVTCLERTVRNLCLFLPDFAPRAFSLQICLCALVIVKHSHARDYSLNPVDFPGESSNRTVVLGAPSMPP